MSTNLTTAEQLSSLASAVKGKLNVLDTLPATVNGGLWLEGGGSVPIIKLYCGGNAFKITPELVIKAIPTLTVADPLFNMAVGPNTTTITYTGDGNLYLFDFTDDVQATIQTTIGDTILQIGNGTGTFKVGATEGTNYAAATPVTVTVTIITLNVFTEDTEATAAIRELCTEGLTNEGNVLAYWPDYIQDDLSGMGLPGSDMFEVANVQLVYDGPYEDVTVTYKTKDLYVDVGGNYYVIFIMDEYFSDYSPLEAVGQSDNSITFELPAGSIASDPMPMVVLKALQ